MLPKLLHEEHVETYGRKIKEIAFRDSPSLRFAQIVEYESSVLYAYLIVHEPTFRTKSLE
jgi:hypothetical protein